MPSRTTKGDADADIAALVRVLRAEPDRVFECVQLRIQTDVPKSIIRGRLEGRPNVLITENSKGKFNYQYRP